MDTVRKGVLGGEEGSLAFRILFDTHTLFFAALLFNSMTFSDVYLHTWLHEHDL